MTQIPLDIERVVREVLAELKRAAGATTNLRSVPGLSGSAENTVATSQPWTSIVNNGELVLSTRLVTMEEIGDRLGGIRQVVVGPQAVVTPAVRDALRQRNIALCRALPANNSSAAPLRLLVVAARTKMDPKLLANTLRAKASTSNAIRPTAIGCYRPIGGRIGQNQHPGIAATPHTAAAQCLANRLAGVRAMLGSNTKAWQADVSAVGANLLVIDPQSVGLYKLCQDGRRILPRRHPPLPGNFTKTINVGCVQCTFRKTVNSNWCVSAPSRKEMRIADVIGTVTLNRRHPSLTGKQFKFATP